MSTFTSKLNDIYKEKLGRNVKAEGAGYWKQEYDRQVKAGVDPSKAIGNIAKIVGESEEAKNRKTVVTPERKAWQKGEDSTGAGNFHDMETIKSDTTKKKDYTDQITGYFEEKGLLANTPAMDAKINTAMGAATAADGFRTAMKSTPSGEERGDRWGTKGRDYLLGEAVKDSSQVNISGKRVDLATNLINKLYTEGYGREADAGGLKYWTNQLYEHANSGGTKGMSYANIAGAFLGSDEAKFRDVYHDEFGRDADDVGLQGWLSAGKMEGSFKDILKGSKEGAMRQAYSEILGQHSKATDRDKDYFTDVHEGGYKNLDWTTFTGKGLTGEQLKDAKQSVDFGHGSTDWKTTLSNTGLTDANTQLTGLAKYQADKSMTTDKLKELLRHREKIQNIGSTYDTDDAEGGTNIGNIFTLKELETDHNLQKYKDDKNLYATLGQKLGETNWNLLKTEKPKDYKDPDKAIIDPEKPNLVDPGTPQFGVTQNRTHRNTLHSDYVVPTPTDFKDKAKATVTKGETDYMSKFDGSYGKKLDTTTYKSDDKPKQISRSIQPFMASQSAQGVARKRSAAFRSGASATGTKQFQRKDNMKIQSLNL